ncbi:MAG: hypothetical protein ABI797_00855 [Chloroflexota bacterium]
MRSTRTLAVLVLALMLPWFPGCSSPTPTAAPIATPSPTIAPTPAATASAAAADLDNLLREIENTHPDPWHGIAREEWVAQMEALKAALPGLSPDESYVELCRLVALLSREGRDGHQFTIPFDGVEGPVLPFRTYEFEEGVFITDAMPGYEDLVGKQIVGLNGRAIDDVLDTLEPLIPRDGPQTVPGFRTIFLLRMSVLRGLGLAGDGAVALDVAGHDGVVETVSVEPAEWPAWRAFAGDFGIALPTRADTMYLSRPGPSLWWRELSDANAVYVRYEAVQSIATSEALEIADAASAAGVEKVILDLRQNPGGDNHFFELLLSLLQGEAINRPGHLYVMTDRITFSAASNFATSMEQRTSALFAGEEMGGGLNFWNDVNWVDLPHWPTPSRVGVSTRYWQFAGRDDMRVTITPDIAVPVTAADYFADRDPALEAVLAD